MDIFWVGTSRHVKDGRHALCRVIQHILSQIKKNLFGTTHRRIATWVRFTYRLYLPKYCKARLASKNFFLYFFLKIRVDYTNFLLRQLSNLVSVLNMPSLQYHSFGAKMHRFIHIFTTYFERSPSSCHIRKCNHCHNCIEIARHCNLPKSNHARNLEIDAGPPP